MCVSLGVGRVFLFVELFVFVYWVCMLGCYGEFVFLLLWVFEL